MWSRLSHTLAPLTKTLSSKMKLKWTNIEQDVFEEIKRIVSHNILLAYPDFNKEFKTHTDTCDFQLGAVVIHNGKPIALYSTKLTGDQMRYTVT